MKKTNSRRLQKKYADLIDVKTRFHEPVILAASGMRSGSGYGRDGGHDEQQFQAQQQGPGRPDEDAFPDQPER
ncbi:hypothetical protein [Rhizobium sp. CF080]|uniref:hypothetical protein n=1 Tax=Rhizobium sp. (strain CF080) TaxID=1144310 RepID=UPI0018CC49E1|nr:hypothetical protein [Rhizobium sp. CF080]